MPGRGAAERALPVGADDEPDTHRSAGIARLTPAASGCDGESGSGDVRDFQLRRALMQRRDEMTVLDIVAERLEANLGGRETTSGARSRRRVSSTIRIPDERRGVGRQASHTPNVASAVTEPARNAVVRKSSLQEAR